ncbi:MAG TPA: ABC transporter permease [Caldilineae bacterium]|nr:ABC transporter permease [Caldilineae bacterium]
MGVRDWPAILWETFRRDVRIALTYRLAFVLRFLSTLFQVAVFYFISKLVAGPQPGLENYQGGYFAYALIGLAFIRLFSISLSGYAGKLTEAQQIGVLEAQALLPVPLPLLIFGSNLWPYLYAFGETALYLLLGLVLGAPLAGANAPGALVIALLASVAISGLGIMGAALILAFKRGNAVSWVVEAAAALLSGVYFPPQILPQPVQKLSLLLPHTYALKGLREALLNGASFAQLTQPILVLAGFSLALIPLGAAALAWALRQAQIKGDFAQY